MKTKILFGLMPILFTGFMSCSDNGKNQDIIADLRVERENAVITNGQTAHLKILSGNKDYTVVSYNEKIVEAAPQVSSENSYGIIALRGKKNGESTILITDNISGQHTTVNIKVVDAYMVLTCLGHSPVIELATNDKEVGETILHEVVNKFSIPAGNIIVLFKNEEHKFCSFNSKSDYENGIKAFEGKYEFLLNNKAPYLEYEYRENESNKILTHQLSSEPGNLTNISVISDFFDLEWDITSFKSARSSVIGRNFLETFEDFTDEYKTLYNIVNTVLLKSSFKLDIPSISDLPENL